MLDGGIIQRLLEEKWKTFARVRSIFVIYARTVRAIIINYLVVIINIFHVALKARETY